MFQVRRGNKKSPNESHETPTTAFVKQSAVSSGVSSGFRVVYKHSLCQGACEAKEEKVVPLANLKYATKADSYNLFF